MKLKVLITIATFLITGSVFAQSSDPRIRPRKVVVVTDDLPKTTPTPIPRRIVTSDDKNVYTKPVQSNRAGNRGNNVSYGNIRSHINEAKRQLRARPIPTSITSSFLVTDIIRLAFYDKQAKEIDYVVMSKESFLKTGAEIPTISSNGKGITVRIIRANGVNTPVMVIGQNNVFHLPLLVQYPREKNGKLIEMAYYVSTHPGLVTPEVVNAGKLYIRNKIDIARENLRKKGIYVSPEVTDMAERLAIVEHIDPWRFKKEYQPNLFDEVYTLYALNQGQTYRYAVSTAGAGGMAQMIPSTYRMIQRLYPQANLMPNFVSGMRDHVNAAEAMLIYMQMTWRDLVASSTVNNALETGIATPMELMAAGYNSNPAKLPRYISRGGANWKNLIPRETQMYIKINESMDIHVPKTNRAK